MELQSQQVTERVQKLTIEATLELLRISRKFERIALSTTISGNVIPMPGGSDVDRNHRGSLPPEDTLQC